MRHDAIDRDSIAAAEHLIRPFIRRTPTIEISGSDFRLSHFHLTLKLELLQHAGSFKSRGAFTHLLTRTIPEGGVVAASGGNHGAAVAYAARQLGIPAAIFVPEISSPAKLERIRSYGARLIVIGAHYNDSLAASRRYAAETGALPIHAYDEIETLRGQGTVGLEFEQQAPDPQPEPRAMAPSTRAHRIKK